MASAVPDSPWVLVSKLDVDEAFVEAQRGEWLALALLASLALLSGGCAAAAWQWRAWRRERGLKLALERNMRWLDSAQKAASAGYFAYDAEHQKFFMSSMAHAIFGLPPQEYMTLQQWMDMVHPAFDEVKGEKMTQVITEAPANTSKRAWIEGMNLNGDEIRKGVLLP